MTNNPHGRDTMSQHSSAANNLQAVELRGTADEGNDVVEATGLERSEIQRRISNRRKAAVLMWCSILQLPIWGFAMTYGIFQEYYLSNWTFHGSEDTVGVIGMTSNGVMYLSMPFLFAAFSRRWARFRRIVAVCGVMVSFLSFLLSSFSSDVWHLVATQGVLAALGCVLVYSPTTLSLSEYFSANNRALAYGIVFSAKNITGTTCPFLVQYLLEHYGFQTTMRIWAAIAAVSGLGAVLLMPMNIPGASSTTHRSRKLPWDWLHHQTIYVYSVATMFQSSGYGIAQTYLNNYAHSITSLSATSSTLLLTLFNAPGIISSSFFGLLSDNKRLPLSSTSTTFISAFSSALAAFFLWGFASASTHSMVLLVLFALVYGFFASGYSATWGGVIKEMETDASDRNELIDTGMVYGMLNGARGIGYVGGGLAGVQLLKAGNEHTIGKFAYGTSYGPLILYTGLSTLLGGWSIALKCRRVRHQRNT